MPLFTGHTMVNTPLTSTLLADVSRSFYLSIRVLPEPLREPVAIAYLLARLSDTLADEPGVPAADRKQWLEAFASAVSGGQARQLLTAIAGNVTPQHPGEAALVRRAGECFQKLAELPDSDREEVRTVLSHIVRGQQLDVERFADADRPAALPDAAALDEYTYLVAGCVGEFWTRLSFRHCANYARLDEDGMVALGIDFGMGLQLVNVLRDVRADLQNGRCYLPESELRVDGVTPENVFETPAAAGTVFGKWLAKAAERMESGFRYIEAVRPFRMRYACFLPWHLGVKTLRLLRAESPLETTRRLKVSRASVRRSLVWGVAAAGSNAVLRRARR